MTIFEQIDSTAQQANDVIKQKRRRMKVTLYAEGLKAKLRQADFALSQLKQLANQTDSAQQSTDGAADTILDRVYFFSDTFWAFLYSALDVLAQLSNQVMKLGIPEKSVSFKSVLGSLQNQGHCLHGRFLRCAQSRAFRNLDDYRNCSTHRRQICIYEQIACERLTAGYVFATGPITTVTRLLCDNPLNLTPRYRQERRIPDYMENTQARILQHMTSMLCNFDPVP